jgi:hypothetical protein
MTKNIKLSGPFFCPSIYRKKTVCLKRNLKEDREIRQTKGQNKKHIKLAYSTKDQLRFISSQFINKRG